MHFIGLSWMLIILIMVQHERMMFSLNIVDYPMSFLLLSTWTFFARQVEGPF